MYEVLLLKNFQNKEFCYCISTSFHHCWKYFYTLNWNQWMHWHIKLKFPECSYRRWNIKMALEFWFPYFLIGVAFRTFHPNHIVISINIISLSFLFVCCSSKCFVPSWLPRVVTTSTSYVIEQAETWSILVMGHDFFVRFPRFFRRHRRAVGGFRNLPHQRYLGGVINGFVLMSPGDRMWNLTAPWRPWMKSPIKIPLCNISITRTLGSDEKRAVRLA